MTGGTSLLELELTGFCQLACRHCYADSGVAGTHGTMTADHWRSVIDQAATIGVEMVQFIGGEPTLHPELPRLIRYALGKGLKVDVYTNLVHVTEAMWEVFSLPGVSVGTSWYSADPHKHAEVTGAEGSYFRTRANIAEAVRRGVPLRAGIVEVVAAQGIAHARWELQSFGVTDVSVDRVRGVGRAARGAHSVSELCGNCGRGRAAISIYGQVFPCVIGRFLVAGNVKEASLGKILDGDRWQGIVALIPPRGRCTPMGCTPMDGNDCNPSVVRGR